MTFSNVSIYFVFVSCPSDLPNLLAPSLLVYWFLLNSTLAAFAMCGPSLFPPSLSWSAFQFPDSLHTHTHTLTLTHLGSAHAYKHAVFILLICFISLNMMISSIPITFLKLSWFHSFHCCKNSTVQMDYTVYLFICWWTLCWSHFLVIVNSEVIRTNVQYPCGLLT